MNNLKKSVYSKLVIAIDGPAGAGKSTVAIRVAHDLGIRYLDTGAMYRAFALKAKKHGIGPQDEEAARELCKSTVIDFGQGDPAPVFLDGANVTSHIRTPEIGDLASALSVFPSVRRFLAAEQKRIVEEGSVILEGRDTTTVIAPDAPIRIFLTASLDERARRRYQELIDRGLDVSYEEIKNQIAERDHRDSNREDSPLRIGDGVTEINTDGYDVNRVVEEVLKLVHSWESKQESSQR